jgi:hypothetical protein
VVVGCAYVVVGFKTFASHKIHKVITRRGLHRESKCRPAIGHGSHYMYSQKSITLHCVLFLFAGRWIRFSSSSFTVQVECLS